MGISSGLNPFIALRDGTGETIQDLFAEQVAHTPDSPAVTYLDRTLTYAELNGAANRLAHRLIDLGVAPGTGVAFVCDRNPLMLISLLGVLKTGAYYIPIDANYPGSRISHILDDAEPRVLITDRDAPTLAELGVETAATVVHLTDADTTVDDVAAYPNPGVPSGRDDVIYSIYTSGSTGKPKGTINFQRGVVNLNQWMVNEFGVGPRTRTLIMTSIGFDSTAKPICSTLLSGGCVVLYDSVVYDPERIRRAIDDYQINFFFHTPTGLYGLIDEGTEDAYRELASVERIIVIGEALRVERVEHWLNHPLCNATLVNGYGPTEAADQVSAHTVNTEDFALGGVCSLGTPLPNVVLSVRDSELRPVALGEKGEMCVQGIGVGGGYRNLPEQTAKAFVDDPHPGPLQGHRLYRTGDLVSQRADGEYLYHGRMDFQVKVRGQRLELGEIETVLNRCPGVLESVVTAPELPTGERFLAAYVRLDATADTDAVALREQLSTELPEFMVPASYTFMDVFPVNASFKVDRKALPAPIFGRPPLHVVFREPSAGLEQHLTQIWEGVLGFSGVGADDPFFEIGGNSLLATRLVTRITKASGVHVPIATFFESPTVAGLAELLRQRFPDAVREWTGEDVRVTQPSAQVSSRRRDPSDDLIAIVGMSARVPGAGNVEQFWANLVDGVESIRLLSAEELAAAGIDATVASDSNYVPASAWIADSESFDSAFFGYAPIEADRIDPQQRVLLELASAAFEDAGIATATTTLRAGIYASVSANSYLTRNILPHDGIRDFNDGYAFVGNDKDFAANRISYKLGLTGPAFTVQTACSSSGVAIHLARQALLTDDCDVALVGAASLPWEYRYGHRYEPDGVQSADGRVRAFDAGASGMVWSGGGACLVLRRLADAVADGQTIHAVVRTTALNNDGSMKASFSAPSVSGQRAVIRSALDRSGVDARNIGAVEAHGTGTRLGDPIEVAALTQAWREDTADVRFCALGSVKSNVGHLDAAAAVTGALKLALMLRTGIRPATVNFENPNPACELDDSPFFVNATTTTWDSPQPRIGAVSSFGFGGTNFHAILEQPPVRASVTPTRQWQVLRLSAKTESALTQQIADLAHHLESTPHSLSDIAFTLDTGRNRYPHRAAIAARTSGEARDRWLDAAPTGAAPATSGGVLFTFPGQGAQHVGMGRRLYESEPVFREALDRCATILQPRLNLDIRDHLFGANAVAALQGTRLAQPAIFAVSYAVARLWESLGIRPVAMIGHSVGEFVAATLAGVFELEHALAILAERARLMDSMPAGAMLAVRLDEQTASAYTTDDVTIAGVNAPALTVLSGPREALDAVNARLIADGAVTTELHTSHAFHSSMMDPIVDAFAEVVGQYPARSPQLQFYSSLTGLPITAEQAQDPRYWADQLRSPVRFGPALAHAIDTLPASAILECGPGQNLTASARQVIAGRKNIAPVASLPHSAATDAHDADHFFGAVARLFIAGVETDPSTMYGGTAPTLVGLPTYPFARTRHWLESPDSPVAVPSANRVAVDVATALGEPQETGPAATVRTLIKDITGIDLRPGDERRTFLDLGFDSLLLAHLTAELKRHHHTTLTFRQLLDEIDTPDLLVEHLGRGTLETSVDVQPSVVEAAAADPDGILRVPSSESQREVWLGARFAGRGSIAYNLGHRIDLAGALDEAALRAAIRQLIDRHESLRSHFSRDGKTLLVHTHADVEVALRDLSDLPEDAREDALAKLCDEHMATPFSLGRGPLVRFTLIRTKPEQHCLIYVVHHAISDGWSSTVIAEELGELYSAYATGREPLLPNADRYSTYTALEAEFQASAVGQAHRRFWLTTLSDVPLPPQLPPDQVPEGSSDLRANRLGVELDGALWNRIREFGAAHNSSAMTTLLAAFATLLKRETGRTDLVVGIPAAGQSFYDQRHLVGQCVNLLPLRLEVPERENFLETLRTTRTQLIDAFEHQGVSYGTLIPQLQLPHDGDRPRLISMILNITGHEGATQHAGVQFQVGTLARQAEMYELYVNVVEDLTSWRLEATYRTALYSEDTIRKFLLEYAQILRTALT